MGRTRESKENLVNKITQELAEAQMALVLDYQGLSVAEITQLRDGLAESGAICTVAKNTLVKKAIAGNETWSELEQLLKGTNALLLAKGDVGSAIKAYQPNCAVVFLKANC
jgi:large subunit ribosomal protein L10